MSLMDNFRAKMDKVKVAGSNKRAEFDVMYSTGFLSIDYLNGTTVHVESEERNFTYNSVGIVDGSTNTIIGRSGSGKSTLLRQIAGNIMRQFDNALLFDDDIEGSLPWVRKEFLYGLDPETIEKRCEFRNRGITTENVYQRIHGLYELKIQNRKEFEYDTGLYDTRGNRIYKLVPSIYIIDSLPMLLPEDLANDDELGGSMDASSIAKKNTSLLKKISQDCKEANIILFTINHILDEIQMGFIPKAAQISGLKQGERLPGGKAAIYLANNMFRVDDSLTLKADKDFGIDGSVITLTQIKSRTNATKRSIPLIFNKTEGRFDELLSLFQLLKSEGVLQGTGVYYLESAPDIKFKQKNFKEVIENSPELQKAFAEECYKILSTFLSDTKIVSANNNTASFNINNMVGVMGTEQINQ